MPSVMQGSNSFYFGRGVGTATIKAAPGLLRGLHAVNRNVAVRYLQFYTQTTGAPSGTTNFLFQITVPLSGSVTIGEQLFRDQGLLIATGITYGWSSSATTYTAGTASDHDLAVVYQ